MRAAERDVLLFLLATSAGSADGWSYFGLGHAFVANMTGNTVLLGLAVFQVNGDLIHPLISLAAYVAGVAIASFLTRKGPPGVWSKAISGTLLLEAVLMASAEAGWILLHLHAAQPLGGLSSLRLNFVLATVALAIGLQSGAMLQLKIPGVVTTYITGTWTTLMNSLVRLRRRQKRQPRQKLQFEERLLMQSGILTVYFVSAVLTGWLFRKMPLEVGGLSALSVLLAAVYGAFRTGEAGQ